jgi:uncharacterized DUF497 family protein
VFEFEWDEAKRLANIEKHGIEFEAAKAIFDGRPVFALSGNRDGEPRSTTVAVLSDAVIAVVWTWRGHTIRLISARSASRAERRQYRQLYG